MKPISNILFLLFFLAINIKTWGQPLDFEADVTKGCAPLGVTITNVTGATNPGVQFKYSFFEGQPFGDINSITYTEPGTYTVVVLVQDGSAAVPITKENYIEVIEPRPPTFEVSTCEGLGVRVSIIDTLYDFYTIDYGDGSPLVTVTNGEATYTYADETTRQITVKGGFTGGGNNFCGTSSVTFTPRPALRPATISLVQSEGNGNITLDYTIFPDAIYYLEESVGGGTFNQISTLESTSNTIVLNSRMADNQAHCYRIYAFDFCSDEQVLSNTVCVSEITLADAMGVNRINWPEISLFDNFQQFNILIDEVNSAQLTEPNTTTYDHQDVTCNIEYCYQLEIQYADGVFARSSQKCLVASSSELPPIADNVRASIDGEAVVLSYEISNNTGNVKLVTIQRTQNNTDPVVIESTVLTSNTLTDSDVDVNTNSYCYQIIVQDQCDNLSENNIVFCTVLLNAIPGDNGNELTWTPFEGFPFGFSYTIEVLDDNGDIIRSIDNLPRSVNNFTDTEASDPSAAYIYRIRVVADHNAAEFTFSNNVRVIGTLSLKAPEAFTPNGDGLNDTFFIRGNLLESYKLRVFNRWGDLMFISEEQQNGWDGTLNGNEAPAGTYSFLAEATDVNGNNASLKGLFLLVR